MKCKHCGHETNEPSKFCPICGNKFDYNTGEEKSSDKAPKLESGQKDKKENKEETFEKTDFDKSDRTLRENRSDYKDTPANLRSTIEKVQSKVYLNKDKKSSDKDYYIDENFSNRKDGDLEKKIDRLLPTRDKNEENITISQAIRKAQKKYRKIDADKSLLSLKDRVSGDVLREIPESVEAGEDSGKDQVSDEKIKDRKKNLFEKINTKNILLGLIGVLIALLIALFYLKSKDVEYIGLDLSNYIEIAYEGEDGQAVPKAYIDKDELTKDYAEKIQYTSRDNNKDSYPTPAHELAADIESGVIFQYSKDSNLANGDEITVMANLDNLNLADKYNVQVTNASKPFIVEGISSTGISDSSVDPFNYIKVDFEGESPNIVVNTSLSSDAPEYMHTIDIVPDKTSSLSEGEEVNIGLSYDEEALKETYGLVLEPKNKTFKVETNKDSDSSNSPYIKSITNLPEDQLGDLKYKAGKLIDDTILYKNIINLDSVNYLGAITGISEDSDIKNRVFLIYEVNTTERLADLNYGGDFKYYTFVEYQNVKKEKDSDGKFYDKGPQTTDNQIFHKFFVESEYKYYQIEYQGFGFIDQALGKLGQSLNGYTVSEDINTDIKDHFAVSDGLVGEYEAEGQRLSLKEDGSLVYQISSSVHQGSYSKDGDTVYLTIEGVNTDNPISLTYSQGMLRGDDQGEFRQSEFRKIENF